jgi:polyisoprenoid-binding protein YceI
MTTTVSPASRTRDGVDLPLPGTYAIDVSHTSVGFVARHLMVSKTRGQLPVLSGSITIGDDPADSSVEVSIDASGVETGDEKRDGHLTRRSPTGAPG